MQRSSFIQKLDPSAAEAGEQPGSAATEPDSPRAGVYYEILGDGTLRYIGPETDGPNTIKKATGMFNAGKRRDDWSFRLPNEYVQVVSNATSSSAVQPARASSGKSGYENEWTSRGLHHTFWFDDYQCDELRNKLIAGQGVSEIAAAISTYVEQPAAVAVFGVATALCKPGALIDSNDEGSGIEFYFHSPNLRDSDIYEVMAQQ